MVAGYGFIAARTAGGRKGGRLAGWHPADLTRRRNEVTTAIRGLTADPSERINRSLNSLSLSAVLLISISIGILWAKRATDRLNRF